MRYHNALLTRSSTKHRLSQSFRKYERGASDNKKTLNKFLLDRIVYYCLVVVLPVKSKATQKTAKHNNIGDTHTFCIYLQIV